MATADAAFLEEVDDFLVSFDLPAFPTLRTLIDDEKSDEVSLTDAISAPKSMDNKTKPKSKKKTKRVLDPVAKHELDKAKNRKRRSAYRERRRIEKETLQQQVEELTTELQKVEEVEKSLASSAWEMVAKRQLQARVNAEEKQRRLIQAIESRAALIKECKGFLHDKVDADVELGEPAYKHKRLRLEPSDAEFYKAYTQMLDNFYTQTDETLKSYGMDSTAATWDGGIRRQWKGDGETGYYVYTDKYVMPFNFQHVHRYTWKVAQMQHRQEDREQFDGVGVEDPENTSAIKFRVSTCLNSGRTVSVLQRAVARRYSTDDRSVVVWRSFTEGEGMFTGMHADESGWCVSVPLSSSPKSSTLIRTMIRHVPMHFTSKSAHEVDTKQFTGFVLDTVTEDALEIGNRLETLLLQDK